MTEQPKKRRNSIWLFVIIVVFGYAAYAFISTSSIPENPFLSTPTFDPGQIVTSKIYAKDLVAFVKDTLSCPTGTGYTIVSGKVENVSDTYDLWLVEIRARLTDDNGQVVNTKTFYIDSDVLFSGATSTYKTYIDNPDNKIFGCRVTIEDAYFKE